MATLVLLVLLAIVWAGVGVYWLRTRMPTPSLAIGSYTRQLSSLDSLPNTGRASVVPIRGVGTGSSRAGHSLTDPARSAPAPAPGPVAPRTSDSVTSAQARLRRRNVLLGLAGMSVITLLAAFVVGGAGIILIHLLIDALLLGFVLLLVQYQREIELARTQYRPVIAGPRQSLAATGTDGRL